MWLASLRRLLLGKTRSPQVKHGRSRRPRFIPTLDYLEERIALSNITVGAGDTVGLVNAIIQANSDSANHIADTITLTNSTYTIASVNNTTNGANALPVITATNLTIDGSGSTLDAATLGRLFNMTSNAGLTLENLTLEYGKESGANAQGGAIYDAGSTLTLNNVTVTGNVVIASGQTANGAGNSAQGAGLYVSGGTVHLTNSTIKNSQAEAAQGAAGAAGGSAQGGGVYANGATLIISGGAIQDETVKGGDGGSGTASHADGGAGGNAEGGGVYTSNSTLVINGSTAANDDSIYGGYGGAGDASGHGGVGGQALGGAVAVKGGSVSISGSAYLADNSVYGGSGGTGGSAAVGGAGGVAEGGGLYVLAAPVTLTSGTGSFVVTEQSPGINLNTVQGGPGGSGGGGGGAGGAGQGGGVFASGSNLPVVFGNATTAAAVDGSSAFGGLGGNAATAGVGGDGGDATGGDVTIIGDKLSLTNATIIGGAGYGGNGGNGVFNSKGYVISNFGNGGNFRGGGLYVSGSSSVTVLNSTFYDSSGIGGGGDGGGIAATGQPYGIGGTVQGGGMYAASSTVNVLNSTFADNVLYAGTGTVPAGSSAASNRETAQGGGLYAAGGSLALINDTIAWNDLATFTDLNQTLGEGGGLYNASSNTLQLENTIIALDQLFTLYYQGGTTYGSTSDVPDDLYDTAATSDHDLIGVGSGGTLVNGSNGDQVGTTAAPINPDFAPALTVNSFGSLGSLTGQEPGNYGGLTYTMPLDADSPALNAGDTGAATAIAAAEGVSTANATDQRGMARVINNEIDIGATQSGLLLSGSAPATVQAGQDITYTITLSNNGPSTLTGVTLTDPLPANTTFVSLTAPAGWTSSTPSVGGTGTVTASIATLAADTTATFSLTVLVGSGAQGTTIVNNASIAYTGTANPVSANLTLSTTVPGAAVTNITSEVGLIETPILLDPFAAPGTYIQAALFINESGAAISGPIALVLTGLPAGVTVTNADGTSNGSPYINIEPPGGTWQPGVRYFLLAVITFSDPTHAKITYTPEVVQGI